MPLTAIAKVMGHGSTSTMEKYAHATDEGKCRAVEALAKKSKPVTKQKKGGGQHERKP